MSSLSQALHLDYLPSSHSAFQDHAAHNAGWSACLDPTAHRVPVYPRVLPHSSIMLHGAQYVWDTPICHEETERGSRQPTNPRADIPKDTAPRSVISRGEGSMIT